MYIILIFISCMASLFQSPYESIWFFADVVVQFFVFFVVCCSVAFTVEHVFNIVEYTLYLCRIMCCQCSVC